MFTRTLFTKAAAVALAAGTGFAALGANASPVAPEPISHAVLAAVPMAALEPANATLATANQEYRAQMRAYLNTLPGGASAGLEWGNPDGHLGGVYIPGGNTIILNASRLDGNSAKTKDVLRHELGHIHQNRIIAANGLRLAEYQARLNEVFGSNGIERSADAVAYLLGAKSFNYQSSFTAAQLNAARAILSDRLG